MEKKNINELEELIYFIKIIKENLSARSIHWGINKKYLCANLQFN